MQLKWNISECTRWSSLFLRGCYNKGMSEWTGNNWGSATPSQKQNKTSEDQSQEVWRYQSSCQTEISHQLLVGLSGIWEQTCLITEWLQSFANCLIKQHQQVFTFPLKYINIWDVYCLTKEINKPSNFAFIVLNKTLTQINYNNAWFYKCHHEFKVFL